jgi:hypothetical protein
MVHTSLWGDVPIVKCIIFTLQLPDELEGRTKAALGVLD